MIISPRVIPPVLCGLACLAFQVRLDAADAAPPAAAASQPATKAGTPPAAAPASVAGKWTSEFETQVGTQTYAYEFKLTDGKLTGTARGSMFEGTVQITDGKVTGDAISFVEKADFGGMEVVITYTGKIAGDEIKFSREVGEFATEELVAKRVKEQPAAKADPAPAPKAPEAGAKK